MLLWAIRAIYVIILAGISATITNKYSGLIGIASGGFDEALLFLGILGGGSLVIVFDCLYPHKRIATISAVYFGLLIGSLLGHLLGLAFEPTLTMFANATLVKPFSLVVSAIFCYVCVSVLLQTKNDFRFIIPYVEFSRELKGGKPLLLDSSVIIDGRIADIANTGMIDQTLVIPRFVLQEVQNIADSSDKLRRNRGKRGLDIIDRLQKCPRLRVEVHDGEVEPLPRMDVDARLVALAKSLNAKLVTNDLNLAKTASIQQIETVNINEVSNAAKPPVLWGESLTVRLVKEGEEPGQGIGYLDDGTMVVAEMGKNFVGTEVNLVVSSVLQTNAGRMVFGRIDPRSPGPNRPIPSRT